MKRSQSDSSVANASNMALTLERGRRYHPPGAFRINAPFPTESSAQMEENMVIPAPESSTATAVAVADTPIFCATLVQDEANIIIEEVNETTESSLSRKQRGYRTCIYLLVTLVIGISIGLFLKFNFPNNTSEDDWFTSLPLNSAAVEVNRALALELLGNLQSNTSEKDPLLALDEWALDWLIKRHKLEKVPTNRIIQRYALASLYHSTGGDSWKENKGWLDSIDECEWHSTAQERNVCMDNLIRTLSLSDNGLDGILPKQLFFLSNLGMINFVVL